MWKRILTIVLVLFLLSMGTARGEGAALSDVQEVKSAVLYEPATGVRLWAMEADAPHSVAGLSKLPAILTLAQSFDEGALSGDTVMQTSSKASGTPGPTAFLSAGEQLKAGELLKAAVMISAGDAIRTLGENGCGSEGVFVENINATLGQLDVQKTVSDAVGSGLQLSAGELAALGAAAVKSEAFSRYCGLYLDGISHSDGRETELVNANRLLKSYPGCKGLLTGSSAEDGYCGVFAAARNGATLIAVVVGAQNAAKRTAAATALLDYGFANFRFETVCRAGEPLYTDVPVRDGDQRTVNLIPREDVTLVLPGKQGKVSNETKPPDYLEAPLSADVPVLEAVYVGEGGESVRRVPLYPDRDVIAYGVKDILLRVLGLFIA